MNYWLEALESSLDEHAPNALSKAQREAVAKDMALAHDGYGESFPVPQNPLIDELKRTQAAFIRERDKVGCSRCRGSGRITEYFGSRQSNSPCDKCHGEGKHA